MQVEREETSSIMMMDPWSIFLFGMKAPMTREKYRGRLAKFFDFIGLTEGTIDERANVFTERAKRQPDWVFVSEKSKVFFNVSLPLRLLVYGQKLISFWVLYGKRI